MTLRVMLPHPPTSRAEFEVLFTLISAMSSNGQTLILGEKRCFICGVPLGAPVPDAPLRRVGQGPTKIFMRLCDDCYRRF